MFDLEALIQSVGYAGIFAIIFAESGLFFGFFLPGDSLLFTAGFLASQGLFNIWFLTAGIVIAAILGDSVGYWSGKKAGPLIFSREDSFWFSKERLNAAQKFFDKFGVYAIVLARFIPLVRTFTPIVAGAASMNYSTFLIANIGGGLFWGISVTLSGYYIAHLIPDAEKYVVPSAVAVFLTVTLFGTVIPLIRRYFTYRKPPTPPSS